MARKGFWRRHRAAVAANTAVAVAAGAVLAYAISADGYTSHETRLNDGGVWVTNDDDGAFGRVNKPINQLDALVFGDQETELEIVQDGAAVVGVNTRSGVASAIDGANAAVPQSATASLPVGGALAMHGGSLASVDRASGEVWAVRVDPETGTALVGTIDSQTDALAEAGGGASLAVTAGGDVVVVSAEERTVLTLSAQDAEFAKPTEEPLPDTAGEPTQAAAVGGTVVTLDPSSGALQVLGGPTAELPVGSVLQQSGPTDTAVLVATPTSLVEVDLVSGEVATVAEGAGGTAAEPVRLGACAFGAWSGGQGLVVTACDGAEAAPVSLNGKASDLVFRVNRGQILLNDRDTGTVWNVDRQTPVKIDNWNAFTRTKQSEEDDKENDQNTQADRRPPRAKPDSYGARPGRTTVLHPLDNDSAPEGRLLAIRSVEQPGGGARVTISPDGQTLQLTLPDDASGTREFRYVIDDGRSLQADATVSVSTRGDSENREPGLRRGFEPRQVKVPAGGAVSVPVLADWRDDSDGDPLILDSAEVMSGADEGAAARTTSAGEVRFTAPNTAEGGTVRVQYAVTDGRSAPVVETLAVQVQGQQDLQPFAPDAQPDVVSGEVGQPVVVKPLANDLPGSDPSSPNAVLALGGKVAEQAGTRVRTDLVNGIVTLRSEKAGTYFLDYAAAYGNAPLSRSRIRVDVRPPADDDAPVAMPDTVTAYGQAAATVDVLANDVDPGGGLLVVQRAVAERENQLDVAVVSGRWLRVSVRQGELTPNPQTVRYTVSNGASTATGEVTVSQRPTPEDNAPVTAQDRVVVRAGSVVTAPVLDNDFSPSGDRLELATDAVADGVAIGELEVVVPNDVKTPPGRAFVAGRTVRYVAPDEIAERDSFEIPYVAVNSTGQTAEGRLVVTVVPAAAENTPPEPPSLEGRVVSGDTVELKLPGVDVDPEGDPVTVTGIASAPALGRIVTFGATSLSYQAFPGSVGTDEFSYTVVDSGGAVATGIARVAVVAPGTPQPPLAVADTVRVAPGRQAVVDVLSNDVFATRDRITLSLVDAPDGVSLDEETDRLRVRAAARADEQDLQVVYRIDNGFDSSLATVTVSTVEGVNNPPVVFDAFGVAEDSDRVSVDVLDGAYDPDGPADALRVAEVYGPGSRVSQDGARVSVVRTPEPQVVPFRVEDADGGSATASLYVPPTGTGQPYVLPDALVEVDSGGERRVSLDDVVADPGGGTVRLIAGNGATQGSPDDLSVVPAGEGGFRVSAGGSYAGPAAALLSVTADPAEEPNPTVTLVSVPVQVGTDRPVLTCPDEVQELTQSQTLSIDVASYCNVWTMDPAAAGELGYEASWTAQPRGLEVTGSGTPVLQVSAEGGAETGTEGVLSVSAEGSDPVELRFRVTRAPAPSLLPIRVPDMRPGTSRTINVASYLRPGVGDPSPTVVESAVLSGRGVTASGEGGARLTIAAGPQAEGRAVVRLVVSDVDDAEAGPERRVEGRIELEVLDVPDAPGAPFPAIATFKNKVPLSWQPPDDNGSPITRYQVREINYGSTQYCATNRCDFRNLRSGRQYNFEVRAQNKAGWSPWSARSRTAVADTIPDRVQNIRMTDRGPNTITVAWIKPPNQTSPIEDYTLTWEGGTLTVPGTQTEAAIAGLDNNRTYAVSISARNRIGRGPVRVSEPFQSLGTPLPPTGLSVDDLQTGNAQTTFRISWAGTLPEGPGPTTYTLFASKNGVAPTSVPGCQRTTATVCNQAGIPYDGAGWTYTVRAYNQPGKVSGPSEPAGFDAVGKPAAWGDFTVSATGENQTGRAQFTVPDSRGTQSIVQILVNGGVVRDLGDRRGAVNETFATPSNEGPATVSLRVCNEQAARGGCSTSAGKSVQTYGPLTGVPINITPQVEGKRVTWNLSGSFNGDPGIVRVRLDGGPDQDFRPNNGPGAWSQQVVQVTENFNQRTLIEVWVLDDNPAGRNQAYNRAEVESGDPPPPAISVFKGTSCSDNPDDGQPQCKRSFIDPGCGGPTCARVHFSTTGWLDPFTCRLSQNTTIKWFTGERRSFDASDGVKTTDWYFGEGYVELYCWSGPEANPRQETSGGFSW